MKVLITGGAGYIGSFMTKRLLDESNVVIAVDNFKKGNKNTVDTRAKVYDGDLLEKDFVSSIFLEEKFDAVIHFAGLISMGESMEKPGIYFENNVFGALNILEEMVKNNINNIIFSSTAGVYGDPKTVPIQETYSCSPTNPYGESKLMVEKMLSWYNKIYDLNFVSLRYFNAAGAALDGSMGENHNPETHIIPNAIQSALSGSTFDLYGDDYDTPDGTAIRDYIHVLDLVEAHVLGIKKLQSEKGGFFYNVGTGIGYSNKEIIEMVKKISGINFSVKVEKRRQGDADVLIADPTRIKKELGFESKYSNLETIIKTAYSWHKTSST